MNFVSVFWALGVVVACSYGAYGLEAAPLHPVIRRGLQVALGAVAAMYLGRTGGLL